MADGEGMDESGQSCSSQDTFDDAIASANEDDCMEEEGTDFRSSSDPRPSNLRVYLPGSETNHEEDDSRPNKLVCDESAYIMLHKAQTGAPCLSFDILKDSLGTGRDTYPMTCYIVCGTQADRSHQNSVIVMKMFNMGRTKSKTDKAAEGGDSSDSEASDDEDPSARPVLNAAPIRHPLASVNRIRATSVNGKHLAASWSERGFVYIWDLSKPLDAVNNSCALDEYHKSSQSSPIQPLYTFSGHGVEGFAMDWSSLTPGQLITGDCSKNIHLWKPSQADPCDWTVDQRPFVGHTASVEDLQWSPNEATVFASCSVDKSIRIWDIRAAPSKACMLTATEAHDRDVNVISWNANEPFIASGGDDGLIKIWDLRQFKLGKSVALFKHHTSAITSIEWHPTDSSVFGASGADHQITLWDLAVERDEDSNIQDLDVPPQLLFIHQGQIDIKEIHWHRQCPGVMVSTSLSGFNIFRTISV